jgi:predicted transposase/invertase (TIGR01784 family)
MDAAIRLAQEKLDMISRDPDLLRAYETYEKAESDWTTGMNAARRDGVAEGITKGIAEGITKGEQAKAMDIGRKLKSQGYGLDKIADITGLDMETVEGL